MDFYCQNVCSYVNDPKVEVLVQKALQNREQFDVISYFVFAVKHPNVYETIKNAYKMNGELTNDIEKLLDDFFNTDINNLRDRRGEYVELLIYKGLYSTLAISRERECVPYVNKQKAEVYFQGKLLDKNFDVGFWDNNSWIELYECKTDIRSIINDQSKWDKLVYLNEIWSELTKHGIDVSVFIGDLSLLEDLNRPPFPPLSNKPFHEVLKESIQGIFKFLNYFEIVNISFFNRTSLCNKFFG